ncbi:DNA polymerase [Murine adenovirus 3]|uniref:DNA polymerase n=2 Tax=Adenoviridae TaxID=10508 RepID=C3SAT8_9ADEN|nr:DNA polymerase [Murine adenovirus 3]ACJ14508.1 DNA polymerase [Murine adenovirus 3]
MAQIISSVGTSSLHPESTNTNLDSSSLTGSNQIAAGTPSNAESQPSSRTPSRGRPRKATVSPLKKRKSKVIAKSHKTLKAPCPNGQYMAVGYFTSFLQPFTNLLCLQDGESFPHPNLCDLFKTSDASHKKPTVRQLTNALQKEEWPAPVTHVWFDGKYLRKSNWPNLKSPAGCYPSEPKQGSLEEKRWSWQKTRPHLTFLEIQKGTGRGPENHQMGLYLVDYIYPCERCEDCGTIFRFKHTCNARRRSYFFHNLQPLSRRWWSKISFSPLGSIPSTQRLFIIYDLETYCWHGSCGKQLVPFMIVMQFWGESTLCSTAYKVAKNTGYINYGSDPYLFYAINPQKQAIGRQFRNFRDRLQETFAREFWERNMTPEMKKYIASLPLGLLDLTPQKLPEAPQLTPKPQFIEVYVVGHNINGFDEIVVAAQVLNNRINFPPPIEVHRHFMPRNGRILFNDITFSLPNPLYEAREDFGSWEEGRLSISDSKIQYVKFMVRDTFALTHTSLRKAAEAYALPVEKGLCPYAAINDFYMTGKYESDSSDGFPSRKYWSSDEEFNEAFAQWRTEQMHDRTSFEPLQYNLIEQTLKYCIKDVQVTTKLVCKLFSSYKKFIQTEVQLPKCSFNIFQRPTISANSHAIFKQTLYTEQRPGKPNFHNCLLAPSREMYDFVRQSIRGGRCYPTYLGEVTEPIYVYDICGMYASALTHPMPTGWPLDPKARAEALENWQIKLSQREKLSYFDSHLLHGIVLIDADPPSEKDLDVLPPFCSRKGGRLCWTNETLRGEVATTIDVITLHNRGWKVKILPEDRTTLFPQMKCLVRTYVTINIAAKERADKQKNMVMRSIAKLLSNALYGSFATRQDNKCTLFTSQLQAGVIKDICEGEQKVKAIHVVETDNLSAEILTPFKALYQPAHKQARQKEPSTPMMAEGRPSSFYSHEKTLNHALSNYKPITFLEAEADDLTLVTLERSSPLVGNDRYASHLASFVLAWTRGFMSEWSEILYESDRGIALERRLNKSVYGDTDSLFVTEHGRILMETRGQHRLKKNGGKLVFNPNSPQLTWLVECETQCKRCNSDAFSPRTIFLAPKLYALQKLICQNCGEEGPGKLRAKGHAVTSLSYDMLHACFEAYRLKDNEPNFYTSRQSLRRTLISMNQQESAFTVTETTLTRSLRPWQSPTLASLGDGRLVPYSSARPNPRNRETTWIAI